MRIALAAIITLLSYPALACDLDHLEGMSIGWPTPCKVDLLVHPKSNPVPVKWMKDALRKNCVCSTLISMPTASGSNDKYHKHKKRDTIIVVPDGLENANDTDIIYWFHGLTGFKHKTFAKRLAPQYSWLVNDQKWPAILVVVEMPWSYFTKTQWKRQGKVFRKKNEFLEYTKEVEQKIMQVLGWGRPFRFNRVIIGHSAVGSAIASAALRGGLCDTNPIGVVFSDSTYGSWFDKAWRGCLGDARRKRKFRIMVLGQSFGRPWKNFLRWKSKNKMSSKYVESYRLPTPWTHGRIVNNAIPFFYNRFLSGKYENIYQDEK